MENPTNLRCGAPRCSREPSYRFALAFRYESPTSALQVRPQYRCTDHLTIADLNWLPGLEHGMVVVIDPAGVSPAYDDERSDTVRMSTHLIDVDELRPLSRRRTRPSVTSDATQVMAAVVAVPGQLAVPGTDR